MRVLDAFGAIMLCVFAAVLGILLARPTATTQQATYTTGSPSLHLVLNGVEFKDSIPVARRQEYQQALRKNCEAADVKAVHVLWEGKAWSTWGGAHTQPWAKKVVNARTHAGRMTFFAAMKYINEELAGEVVMLTNADIVVSGGFSTENLLPSKVPDNTVLIPQREELPCNDPFTRPDQALCDCRMFQVGQTANCFDSYLFRAPLPRKLVDLQAIGFPMGGQWGTENAWVVELRAAGISVYTPKCGIFKLVHYHCSQARPNQKGEIMPSRIKLRSDRVCFEAICQSTCVRETVPSDDLITKVCQDVSRCHSVAQEVAWWTRHSSEYADNAWCKYPNWPQIPRLKFVIFKGREGLGDRMQQLLYIISYVRRTGRVLVVDWQDGRWAEGLDVDFHDFFRFHENSGIKIWRFQEFLDYWKSVIPDLSVIPETWQQLLGTGKNPPDNGGAQDKWMLDRGNKDILKISETQLPDFLQDVVVYVGAQHRTSYYSNYEFIKLSPWLEAKVVARMQNEGLEASIGKYTAVHLRGGDKPWKCESFKGKHEDKSILPERDRMYKELWPDAASYIEYMWRRLAGTKRDHGQVVVLSDQECLKRMWHEAAARHCAEGTSNTCAAGGSAEAASKEQTQFLTKAQRRMHFMSESISDFVVMSKAELVVSDGLSLLSTMAENAQMNEDFLSECLNRRLAIEQNKGDNALARLELRARLEQKGLCRTKQALKIQPDKHPGYRKLRHALMGD